MKQQNDFGTLDLFGFRPAGRPVTGKAKPGRVRTAEHRERQKQIEQARVLRLAKLSDASLARYTVLADAETAKDCWLELGRRMGW